MQKGYDIEFKNKTALLHLREGLTVQSLHYDYGITKSTINVRCDNYQQECQNNAKENPNTVNEYTLMKKSADLLKELAKV